MSHAFLRNVVYIFHPLSHTTCNDASIHIPSDGKFITTSFQQTQKREAFSNRFSMRHKTQENTEFSFPLSIAPSTCYRDSMLHSSCLFLSSLPPSQKFSNLQSRLESQKISCVHINAGAIAQCKYWNANASAPFSSEAYHSGHIFALVSSDW